MTAEIAVLNRQAVALAADSAVTVGGGQKVFPSAEKIFALSASRPVGAMVYGLADALGVPWETVLKEYRTSLAGRSFARLEEYGEDLVEFLGRSVELFPEQEQREYIHGRIRRYFLGIQNAIADEATAVIERKGSITHDEVNDIAERVIDGNWRILHDDARPLTGLPEDFDSEFRQRYASVIAESARAAFEKLTLSPDAEGKLIDMAVDLFGTFLVPGESNAVSGIVVAGFGQRDVFPAVWWTEIEGIGNNQAIRTEEQRIRVTTADRAFVAPFAQRDMVDVFMQGTDRAYDEVVTTTVSQLLMSFPEMLNRQVPNANIDARTREAIAPALQEMVDEFVASLAQYRFERNVVPVVEIIASLPKDELAGVAEALVNLTSFKQRVSAGLESVGGPIDVAVISRGDGLVWIRRKQYFESALNPELLAKYRVDIDGSE